MRRRNVSMFRLVALGTALAALAGCSALSGWHTEKAPRGFADGSYVLAELVSSASRERVLAGEGLLRGWRDKLHAAGYTDADIVDGSAATLFTFCYGHNSGVPLCAHHGHYVALVPAELRDGLSFDERDPSGDLVAVRLTRTANGDLVGTVAAVYRRQPWTDCRIERLPIDRVLRFSPVGPPQAMWIECDNAAADGWNRRPVAGAPPGGTVPVSEWVRPAEAR